ncbi:MAG TPA: ATP-binding cassette domain-containing protein [Gaiellaceae bacterium]|nr:ATP-binding cassette domain-containing protein [Gaiellaceae bacterium]
MSAVEATDLFRIYPSAEGSSAALQGLTLEVAEGELLVVFGPSGSGKSTLLRILAGLDRPSAGTVRVFGEDLRKLRGRALVAYRSRTLGYADQHYTRALAPELDARQLVGLRLGLLGASTSVCARVADRLLERVGLLDRRHALPAELSGGQLQRIAICAALAHGPSLFIADEPTGELDAANAVQIYALIRELCHETGVTTIVVSHDPESAAVADRVVQIRDGRVSSETGGDRAAHAVVNKGGWIRLPEELLRRASFTDRARLELSGEGILVKPAGAGAPPAPAGEPRAAAGPPGAVVAQTLRLAKTHGRGARATEVFRDLSVEFSAGELSAVTGPSGSGKSTLLHLLAGLDLPSEGEVVVAGTPLAGLDATGRANLRRAHIGLVTQGTDLVPFLSAQESVELGLALRGVPRGEAARRATATLADVGLAPLAGQRVGRLSMGERQRVALARALAARPALLLADEPTARLDEANARAVGILFAELARRTGTAIVCATHDPVLLEHVATEVPLATVAR